MASATPETCPSHNIMTEMTEPASTARSGDARIVIYSTPSCGYCVMAKRLLDRKGAPYEEVDVSRQPQLRAEMVGRAGGRMTVPQIFIGGQHVGGYTDLAELDRRGQLDRLLAA